MLIPLQVVELAARLAVKYDRVMLGWSRSGPGYTRFEISKKYPKWPEYAILDMDVNDHFPVIAAAFDVFLADVDSTIQSFANHRGFTEAAARN